MVRKYIRKTNNRNWLKEDMRMALKDILDGNKSKREAARDYNIPRTSLYARVKGIQNGELTVEQACQKNSGTKLLSERQENLLIDHILLLDSRLFNVKNKDVQCLAYEIVKSSTNNRFCQTKKMASSNWLTTFFERHPDLPADHFKITYSDSTSVDQNCLARFFDITDNLCKNNNILTCNIYCLDEFGITALPNQISEVINSQTKIEVLSQLDKPGVLITSICCVNASGTFMPPSFVFPLHITSKEISTLEGIPEGSQAEFHTSGRVQTEMFARWLQKFVEFSKPTYENPVLLLLDGTTSHAKSFEFVNIARQNYIHLLSFPLNSVDTLHPLGCFLAQLSSCYKVEVAHWQEEHPEESITYRDIAKLFSAAFSEAAVEKIAVEGFRMTGIVPLNRAMHDLNDMVQSPFRVSTSCFEETSELNHNELLPDISWYPQVPLILGDDPMSVVRIREKKKENKSGLSKWRRRIQKG